ncbi:MAG: TolC family protein [Candidatus Acidoferrales bacterium]
MKRFCNINVVTGCVMVLVILCPAFLGAQTAPEGPSTITLADLEQMALQHNPTLAQAAARVRAARGRRLQVGLYPNPSAGYTADEVSTGPIIRGGEHGFFIEQEIVTAGKLRHRRNVVVEEERQLEAEAERQKLRVLTAVRILYTRAVAAERLVELRGRLARLAREAVDISRQLYNVGQADEPDLIAAEVEAERAELALLMAQNQRERIWRELGAVVGVPSLRPAPLEDTLDQQVPELQFESILERLLRESPELKSAQAAVARAEQAVRRERSEWIPNIIVRGGLRNNRELLELGGRPVGLEGFIDVGVQIPIFNRNQGNVEAARAELERAQLEVERVKLSLRARLAVAFREYQDARSLARRYQNEVLPRAQRAYDLYLSSFQQMAAAYPQVLIAQRTYFQLQVDYVAALERLWQTIAEIRGFLLVDGLEGLPMAGGSARAVPGVSVMPAQRPGPRPNRSANPAGGAGIRQRRGAGQRFPRIGPGPSLFARRAMGGVSRPGGQPA